MTGWWIGILPIAIAGLIGGILGLYFARKERNEARRTRAGASEDHTPHATHS